MLVAAHAFCSGEGLTQEQIADRLGVSQSQVSRLLGVARQKRWLVDAPAFRPPPAGDPAHDLWREAESQFVVSKVLETKFCRAYGGPLRRVIVVDGLDEAYSAGAARALLPLLGPGQGAIETLGVTWGRNIRHVVLALRGLAATPPRADQPIRLVPLCGEPFMDRDDPQSFSSSALVWELHHVLNGGLAKAPLSIAGVHAFIPRRFSKAEAGTIRRFYQLGAGYTSIFAGPEPLVESLDSVLTAVGVASAQHRGIFLAERVHLGDLKESEIPSILGDVSGILIPRKKARPGLRGRVAAVNERWTACARPPAPVRRRPAGGPGVIVAAQAANRARLIHRCLLEERMINTLLISRVLAESAGRTGRFRGRGGVSRGSVPAFGNGVEFEDFSAAGHGNLDTAAIRDLECALAGRFFSVHVKVEQHQVVTLDPPLPEDLVGGSPFAEQGVEQFAGNAIRIADELEAAREEFPVEPWRRCGMRSNVPVLASISGVTGRGPPVAAGCWHDVSTTGAARNTRENSIRRMGRALNRAAGPDSPSPVFLVTLRRTDFLRPGSARRRVSRRPDRGRAGSTLLRSSGRSRQRGR